jgi:sec-independent protein translocase protein TatC
MSFGRIGHQDPDDFFADTRMSFGDHLEDLRLHLWRAIAGFLVAVVIGFLVGKPVLEFISKPVKEELQTYWEQYYATKAKAVVESVDSGDRPGGEPVRMDFIFDEQAFKDLGLDNKGRGAVRVSLAISEPLKLAALLKNFETTVGRQPALSTLNVQEGFLVWVKVSIVSGFVLSSPWIFYQIWAFIAAGLYPHEKRHVNVFLPISIGLFLAGVVVCQFFVIPKAIRALLWFNEWLQMEPDFRLNEYLSFAILMPVVFGLSFQTPLVMLFLERLGILTVETYRSKRGLSWFLMALFAAIILPSGDVVSMLFLWLPMGFLYELGIIMCVMSPKKPAFDLDVPESDELIEV